MKLQNLIALFLIIILPIIIVTSYYMALQRDTINMKASYDTKLLSSTKDAVKSYEIGTVEWNADYSATSDSKRRDIMSSINTFTTSLANNIGIGGTSKETLLTYIPAIAYTLYDGYYIYSPAETKITIKDENGIAVTIKKELIDNGKISYSGYSELDEGKILYKPKTGNGQGNYNGEYFTLNPADADTEYKHILKPFSAYSKEYGGNVIINYTLDNYITVYCEIDGEYVQKSGYLVKLDENKIDVSENNINEIKLDGQIISPEELSENIAYYDDSDLSMRTEIYNYVYATDNTKIYIDDSKRCFILDHDGKKTFIEGTSSGFYKKCTIPKKINGEYSYTELYQRLDDSTREKGNWFWKIDNDGELKDDNLEKVPEETLNNYGLNNDINDINKDYSAINYCVESYVFSKWANDKLGIANIIGIGDLGDPEKNTSNFNQERREVIKKAIIDNLNQAITSYSSNSIGEYQLPVLSETDWDLILSNVSMVTFLQNIPIGTKYYNNYAIVTSTKNKDYVDPNEIYLVSNQDEYYHRIDYSSKFYCSELKPGNIKGYRNIDFILKSYKVGDETKYYYMHAFKGSDEKYYMLKECYNCMIQRDLGKIEILEQKLAYITALARERYIAKQIRLPDELEANYYINVEPVLNEGAKNNILSNAEYTINDDSPHTGGGQYRITKEIGKEYKIEAVKGDAGIIDDEKEDDFGNFDSPKDVVKEDNVTWHNELTSEAEATVTVTGYDRRTGIRFNVSGINDSEWNYTGNEENWFVDNSSGYMSSEADGVINIKLLYERSHSIQGTADVSAYADIESSDSLIIVTTVKNVTGDIRLKFTNENEEETRYSKIFNIPADGATIYCRIGDDTTWHKYEWKVEVIGVGKTTIAKSDVKYYTIGTYDGLKGFSEAMNEEGAKSKDRIFYLRDNIDCNGKTDYRPACYNNKFQGEFNGKLLNSGDTYIIKNLQIKAQNNDTDKNIENWGLFGINSGTIKNVTIQGLNLELYNINTYRNGTPQVLVNKQYKTGGIAGTNNGEISSVVVENNGTAESTIRGTTYTGGIVGLNKGTIYDATLRGNTSVKSAGRYNEIKANNDKNDENQYNDIYVGGIAGENSEEGTLRKIKIDGENMEIGISSKNYFYWITKVYADEPKTSGKQINLHMRIYIGGIAGATSKSIINQTGEGIELTGSVYIGASKNDTDTVIRAICQSGRYKNEDNFVSDSKDHNSYIGGVVGCVKNGDIKNILVPNSWNVCGKSVLYAQSPIGPGEYQTTDELAKLVGDILNNSISILSEFIPEYEIIQSGVGGITGLMEKDSVVIQNCTNSASITGKYALNGENLGGYVGGIVGRANTGWVDSCSNEGKITCTTNIASLGWTLNHASVYKTSGTGGIVGSAVNMTISKSINKNNVEVNHTGGRNCRYL